MIMQYDYLSVLGLYLQWMNISINDARNIAKNAFKKKQYES
jgi:hypothetical protein